MISPELRTNLFTYATLSFAQPFFAQAFKIYRKREVPDLSMLWPLADDLVCTAQIDEFERRWDEEKRKAIEKKRKSVCYSFRHSVLNSCSSNRPRFWLLFL